GVADLQTLRRRLTSSTNSGQSRHSSSTDSAEPFWPASSQRRSNAPMRASADMRQSPCQVEQVTATGVAAPPSLSYTHPPSCRRGIEPIGGNRHCCCCCCECSS